MKFRIAALLAAGLISTGALAADPKQQKTDYERELASVKALSTALQADPKAGSPAVRSTLDAVGARQKEAEDLAAVGEYELAKAILHEGYVALTKTLAGVKAGSGYGGPSGSMSGMTGSDGKPLALAKKKADFERELASAKALLDAARRADAETGGRQAREVGEIEALIGKATAAAGREDFDSADKLVDEALRRERALITAAKGASTSPATPAQSAAADEKAARERAAAQIDGRLGTAKAMLAALKSQNASKKLGRDAAIADSEQKLARAESLRASDPVAALALIDQAYAATRSDLQGMAGGGAQIPSGSAALDAGRRDMSGMGAEQNANALASQLRTARTLRDAYERKSKEKGLDAAATLARIDKLAADARALEGSDPSRALSAADEAYKLAKSSLEAARAAP